jgi:quercetin dioxygenase-like cupin family protein
VVLQVVEHRLAEGDTRRLDLADRIVYDVELGEAEYSQDRRTLNGPLHALSFELVPAPSANAKLSAEIELSIREQRLIRCDRVEFPPGGVAYLHVHQGPGIRVLLHGSIRIDTGGASKRYGPLEAWFEPGPEPVFAAASETEPTAFVRCMVLPAHLRGQSSIQYVREEDAGKPKRQQYTVFVDEPVGSL